MLAFTTEYLGTWLVQLALSSHHGCQAVATCWSMLSLYFTALPSKSAFVSRLRELICTGAGVLVFNPLPGVGVSVTVTSVLAPLTPSAGFNVATTPTATATAPVPGICSTSPISSRVPVIPLARWMPSTLVP